MHQIDDTPPSAAGRFADVILPLATEKPYTYHVPEALITPLQPGMRVEVPFGKNKRYAGIVLRLHNQAPAHRTKPLLSLIDQAPIVTGHQLAFWQWLGSYYQSTLGEIMTAALPAHLKLTSETRVTLGPLFHDDATHLDEKEYLIAEALTIQESLTLGEIQGILQQKTIYPIIRRLLDKRIIYLEEQLQQRYQPRSVRCVRLAEPYATDPEQYHHAFDLVARSDRQTAVLMEFIQTNRQQAFVRQQDLTKRTGADSSVVKAMVKKGIFEVYDREVSRLGSYEEETVSSSTLSEQQQEALQAIRGHFQADRPVLLWGVTGSGKTRVYLELIQEVIQRGGQVLYLLPEIALTTQIIQRLQRVLGDAVAIYHSRISNNERVELWQQVLAGKSAIVGPRSALFLPFQQLELVIIDEEHDPSFKQQDPNPRYHGRDAAVFLAHLHGAKVLMGTATPSLESMQNAEQGKYGLVEMPERFGGVQLPEIQIADVREELRQRKLQSHFSTPLIEALKATLERNEQAILFQNRRGYAPTYRCPTCGWHSECINCDVSLTYHRYQHSLKCHYCGYTTRLPEACPACGEQQLQLQGFGTEKIEDELKIYLPEARIARMDLDTVRGKHAHAKLLQQFESGELDVLVGTQMVTKGLDFERVGLVGVISADQLLHFPDFRATERAFQLLVQVAGRAGRKHRQGQVIIQTFNPTHPVLDEVIQNDFQRFFQREVRERKEFGYPPFIRLIRITLQHKRSEVSEEAAKLLALWLKADLADWVIGPAAPYVGRVRNYYLQDILLKIPRSSKQLQRAKQLIRQARHRLAKSDGLTTVRVKVDVDPM